MTKPTQGLDGELEWRMAFEAWPCQLIQHGSQASFPCIQVLLRNPSPGVGIKEDTGHNQRVEHMDFGVNGHIFLAKK